MLNASLDLYGKSSYFETLSLSACPCSCSTICDYVMCSQSRSGNEVIPGCVGTPVPGEDYCRYPDPTAAPTPQPTPVPTSEPTSNPTLAPTNPPTNAPTSEPTSLPTNVPTSNVSSFSAVSFRKSKTESHSITLLDSILFHSTANCASNRQSNTSANIPNE